MSIFTKREIRRIIKSEIKRCGIIAKKEFEFKFPAIIYYFNLRWAKGIAGYTRFLPKLFPSVLGFNIHMLFKEAADEYDIKELAAHELSHLVQVQCFKNEPAHGNAFYWIMHILGAYITLVIYNYPLAKHTERTQNLRVNLLIVVLVSFGCSHINRNLDVDVVSAV